MFDSIYGRDMKGQAPLYDRWLEYDTIHRRRQRIFIVHPICYRLSLINGLLQTTEVRDHANTANDVCHLEESDSCNQLAFVVTTTLFEMLKGSIYNRTLLWTSL